MTRLLIAEDDRAAAELLTRHLKREGFAVRHSPSGGEALRLAAGSDLVLLDWVLEDLPGLEVCRRLRLGEETKHIPIIMLPAPNETDALIGLEAGADDYVGRPFSPREVIARIRAVLRRTRPTLVDEVLTFADIEMDLARYRVKRGGHNVALGPTEYRLLRLFLENPRRVFQRERLAERIWGEDADIQLRTVDALVKRLRRALALEGAPDPIRTVRRAGYSLDYDSWSELK